MPTDHASGWFHWPTLWLFAQAFAAALSVRVFRMRIGPNVIAMRDSRAVTASIGPLALAAPMIAGAFRTDWRIDQAQSAAGWLALGAPAACGLLALGIAALTLPGATAGASHFDDHETDSRRAFSPYALLAWTFAGIVLLLLGAAHDMTIWVGQCAFAAGALMLWINTPEALSRHAAPADVAAGNGLSLMLLCGALQAVAVGFVPMEMLPISATLVVMHAAMIFALTARQAQPLDTISIGGWTAALAVLFGLGSISLRHMIPRAFAVMQGAGDRPPLRVAYGFGAFALEAAIMLAIGAMAVGIQRVPSAAWRRLIGAAMIVAAASLAGWRLAAI